MMTELIVSASYMTASYCLLLESKKPQLFWFALIVGILAHFYQILLSYIGIHPEINEFSVMNVLSLVAFLMVVLGALLKYLKKDSISCFVVMLISAVCVWFPLFFETNNASAEAVVQYGWGIKIHVAFSISAYVSLGYAALYACFLLVRDYRLKKGGEIDHIPLALDYIERVMIYFTVIGTILLSFSLLSGVVFIDDIWKQHLAHKTLFSIISLLSVSVLLFRHYSNGFRGTQAAKWLLGSFILLVLAYFGSEFVLQIIL